MLSRPLHYFLAVAEYRSFTRAATALYVSQPALSQQIRVLEEQLGVILFDRSGRQTRLTDAGTRFLQHVQQAQHLLLEGKRALHELNDLSRGHLRIAVTPTFTAWLIGPLLANWNQTYPAITLTLTEMSQAQMQQALREQQIDIGIGYAIDAHHDLFQLPLFEETLTMVVNDCHPNALCENLLVTTLTEQRLVLLSREFSTRVQIDEHLKQLGVSPIIQMEVNAITALTDIVKLTSLATLLPAQIALPHGNLRAIPLTPALLTRTAVMLRYQQAHESPAARTFREMLQAKFHHLETHASGK